MRRDVTIRHAGPIEVPMRRLGLYSFAVEFRNAAKSTVPVHGRSPVRYYLNGHAIELGFKAFSVARGFPNDQLKSLGHDLEKCWSEARRRGLDTEFALSTDEVKELGLLNARYKDKFFEYFDLPHLLKNAPAFADLAIVKTLADRLLAAIKEACE